jgi:hypothetical protein
MWFKRKPVDTRTTVEMIAQIEKDWDAFMEAVRLTEAQWMVKEAKRVDREIMEGK